MRKRNFLTVLMAGGAALAGGPLLATTPSGPVILTLRGKVRGGGPVDLDAAALDTLGTRNIRTRTQWLSDPADWSGTPLDKLLASVGATGEVLRMRALNDYSVTVPMADVARFGPILASRLNGKSLSVRDRGPLIVIYPFDGFPELNAQAFHNRAIWQLREIAVE